MVNGKTNDFEHIFKNVYTLYGSELPSKFCRCKLNIQLGKTLQKIRKQIHVLYKINNKLIHFVL